MTTLNTGNAGTSVVDRSDVVKRYEYWLPICRGLRKEAVQILEDALVRESIKVESVTARVKTLESLPAKMQRTGKPFDQINDLLGLRVICLFRSQIKGIIEVLGREFQILSEDNKFETKDIDTFGYLDVKLIAKLRPEFVGRWLHRLGMKDLLFEIQIRTVGMHAWASVSHHLDYKLPNQVPRDLRRDFQALSALFHVADSQFEAFFDASRRLAEVSVRSASPPDLYSELDLEGLFAYLRLKFPDRISEGTPGAVSQFLVELFGAGIYRLVDLEVAVNRWLPAILAWEETEPPTDPGRSNRKTRFEAVGLVRIAVATEYDRFARISPAVRVPASYRT